MTLFATPNQSLPLPPELRRIVYAELLISSQQPLPLYHDRLGRAKPLHLHPSILRASKTSYEESAPILYNENTFKIDISTKVTKIAGAQYLEYFDRYGVAPRLFRKNPSLGKKPKADTPVIVPSSLAKMQHVEVVTSFNAVWYRENLAGQGSNIGSKVLPSILRALARDCHQEEKTFEKTLKFTAVISSNGRCILDICMPRPRYIQQIHNHFRVDDSVRSAELQHTAALWALLEQVSEKREIEIHIAAPVEFSDYVDPGDEFRVPGMCYVDVEQILDWKSVLADMKTTQDPKEALPRGPARRVKLKDL